MKRALIAIGGAAMVAALVVASGGRDDDAPARTAPGRIVALGDSHTETGAYLREVHRRLGSTGEALGIRGAGAAAISRRSGEVLRPAPDVVIVAAGVNDVASGRALADITDALGNMYAAAKAAGARVVAVPIMPWAGYMPAARRARLTADTAAVNAWIQSAGVDVVPVASLGRNGSLRREYDAGDGLHLNAAGQRQLGALIAKAIDP